MGVVGVSADPEPITIRRGSLEITTYGRSQEFVTLVDCPLCDYEFDENERRWRHFFDEHDFEDLAIGGESA